MLIGKWKKRNEEIIRKNLLKSGLIEGIIGLPSNLFYGTGIPACIIILDKKDAINRSKGSGISNYKDKNSPGKLYYIRFFNDEIEFWKIGITVRDLVNRWNLDSIGITKNLKYEILFINNYDNINDAYIQEQYILNAFDSERVIIDYNGFKTTEAFNKDVLIEYYKKDKIKWKKSQLKLEIYLKNWI